MPKAQIQQEQRFRYTARDQSSHAVITGEQSGENAHAVRMALLRVNLIAENIEEIKDLRTVRTNAFHTFLNKRRRLARRIKRADLFDAIATMLDAGQPLEQGLHHLSLSNSKSATDKSMLHILRDSVRSGVPLNQACDMLPDWFGPIDVAMIAAGQHTGNLAESLRSLSALHLASGDISHRLITALVYPLILLMAACGVGLFLSVYTLPQLVGMLESSHSPIPFLTQLVVSTGHIVIHWWFIALPLLIGLAFLGTKIWQAIPAETAVRQFFHRSPLSQALIKSRIALLAETLAQLQRSGIPLTEAVEVTAATLSGKTLSALLMASSQDLQEGGSLSSSLAQSHIFDDEFINLLHMGEQSGELSATLDRIAKRYHRAATRTIDTLTALLEPVAVLSMAVLIGLIAMAAILPMIEISNAL